MKRLIFFSALLMTAVLAYAKGNTMNMTIGNRTVSVALESNRAVEALLGHLAEGDVTVSTSRYGGFEQVGPLPWPLPADNKQTTAVAGDVVLYNGNQLVVFFGSNSWSYTRLGRIEGLSQAELNEFLDHSNCNIILSLPNATAIDNTKTSPAKTDMHYNIAGQRTNDSHKGVVVGKGRKAVKR